MAPVVGLVGLGATVAGGLVGAAGSIFGGMAQSAMYGYQAKVAEMNARIADQNSAYEQQLGEVKAQQEGMKTKAEVGEIIAKQGASGLNVNSGTNVSIQSGAEEIGAFNQEVQRSDAARRAYGFEVEHAQDVAQAQMDKEAGTMSLVAGGIGAASSLIGGAGSFSSKWLQGQSMGLWGS